MNIFTFPIVPKLCFCLLRFACVGKLAGGHQAAVMCMAVDEVDNDSSLVITGSKDHYIKVSNMLCSQFFLTLMQQQSCYVAQVWQKWQVGWFLSFFNCAVLNSGNIQLMAFSI